MQPDLLSRQFPVLGKRQTAQTKIYYGVIMIGITVFECYILFHTVIYVYFIIRSKKRNAKRVKMAGWVYWFCMPVSFGFSFSVKAILQDYTEADLPLLILFCIATIVAFLLASMQSFWGIEYNETTITLSKFIGIKKTYSVKDLRILQKGRITKIYIGDKKITEYDEFYINIHQSIAFWRFYHTLKK